MAAPAGGLEGQSPNGFLADQDREEASEPMLPNINFAKNAKIKVDTGGSNPETNNTAEHGSLIVNSNKKATAVSIAPASPRLPKVTDTSVKNYKLFCRLVLGIILALIGILCSVFIKPELYFSNYGK